MSVIETEHEHLTVDTDDDVLRIVLDREEAYNAISWDVVDEIAMLVDAAGNADDVRVVVIEGRGDHFSSGGDVDKLEDDIENRRVEHWRDTLSWSRRYFVDAILECPKPVVTKVQGYATGTGSTLATIGDINVVSTDAQIGDLHVQMALTAPNTPAYWPLLVGVNKAKEMAMRGTTIDGEEAERIGLVNHAVPPDQLDEKVEEIVDDLATGPQYAISYNKMMANKWFEFATQFVRREAFAYEAMSAQLDDHERAVTAYVDGESPDFPSGRSE